MASKTLRERAAELGMKAMGKLFEDPKRAEAIAAAIGGLQRAKQALDEAQDKALRAAGLVTRDDFKHAGKRDAGTVDGGTTRADLVSPITAAGSETPVGLEWGEKGEEPAAKIYKNVKVLGELKGNRFMAGMQSMRANLGEKCPMCHLVKQKDFAADTKKEKRRAREMIRMNEEINRRTFGSEVKVTCWMCHRGEEEPAKRPLAKEVPDEFEQILSPNDLREPAEKVFKDVRVLKGMNARQFALIMGWFEQELGVECEHCHGKKGDFAADEPKKVRSREMLEMTSYIADGYYGGKSPVTCGTCHRGKAVPARTPGDKS